MILQRDALIKGDTELKRARERGYWVEVLYYVIRPDSDVYRLINGGVVVNEDDWKYITQDREDGN